MYKKYPKKFLLQTQFSEDGYPSYRRRSPEDGSFETMASSHEVDIGWIAKNMPKLLLNKLHIQQSSNKWLIKEEDFFGNTSRNWKKLVTNLFLAKVRLKKEVTLAVVSSRIAVTLILGGWTAHTAFKLSLNLVTNDETVCNITKNSGIAEVLMKCSLIIWDETTMSHKIKQ